MSQELLLPIDSFVPEIQSLLKNGQNLVITAAPGAGKTTRLPPALLQVTSKKVIVLEPRRMAAIAAAHRIAEEQGWQVGEEIGYQVRFANKTSNKTRLVFMTEALLARQMIDDPELSDVELVILDEFHERSMHVDLALGLLRELQELGRDIKILVMSATLEAEKIASYLGDCPIVSVPGKLFELDVRYQKGSQQLQTFPQFFDAVAQTVKDAQLQTRHDILVFLPGVGEIDRAKDALQSWADSKNIELVPLHGSLNLEDQRRALKKTSQQRVILSTNIAESSVTIDGVNTVIDSGLAKNMKQDHRTGFSRLELGRISLSSAIQRSGRAARQFPGVAYRMWNKMDELSFGKSEVAEIQRVDLTESLLFLSAQGVTDFDSFSWFEKPQKVAIENALRYLRISGAVDDNNKITALGRKILHFPLPVRLAKLMLVGMDLGAIELASEMAALLQERDILRRESVASFLGDNLECDLSARLEVLHQFRQSKKAPAGSAYFSLQTVDQAARQIQELAKRLQKSSDTPTAALKKDQQLALTKKILLTAYADRLCRRRGKTERALMVGGRGVKLQNETLVKNSEFFAALNGVEGSSDAETMVSLACGAEKDFVLDLFRNDIVKTRDVSFVEEKGQFFTREYRSLYGLPLEEPSLSPASATEVSEKLPQILADKFDLVLKTNEALSHWWERLQFLQQQEDLNLDIEKMKVEAFTQACMGESKMQAVMEKDLCFFFESVLPPETANTLRREIPDRIEVPSGSKIRVIYPSDKPPYLEVRIQEVFGLMQTPKVYKQTIPITLHLLGPNFRPVQVTSNLESFWKNGYPEVRKELRIKYPKHQWPEDPADGIPEAKGRRRH
ncbi:ATP-dependent RNA helicase HrpB [Bdellovibrio bacteriovorus]|uniref:ATP-dependent helicase HrpB n=1 Tax=Bdellovibrio bacteriovorus TaxID=959 RepID=UPI00045BE9C6|nr:ATP-dependent helicase HrpB [Bdellovibrio bacteriovorus]AHZ83500.1 helicase [Bdellovibrio bacteriovorus]BEV69470.1 ATP-dependent RNA helicase HrpB [Bdellovibrio bacteriovorus]